MLNVSSFYLFLAMTKDFLARHLGGITAAQWGLGFAGLCAICALLQASLPAPRSDARIDWGKALGKPTALFAAMSIGIFVYGKRQIINDWALRAFPWMQNATGDIQQDLLLAGIALAMLVLLPVYLLSSKAPNDDSTLSRRQGSGLLLVLLILLSGIVALRMYWYGAFVKVLLTGFIVAEIINCAFWFYDPLVYLLSRLFSLPARPPLHPTPGRMNRFAIIGCAHNEEAVVAKLVESLYATNYPRDCYDLYVICDNCADDTAGAVERAGGIPMVRADAERRGKGYALEWMFGKLAEMRAAGKTYDAYIVLDADNVVNEAYLDAINARMNEGHEILQTYLGCKNPDDTWVSKAYSLGYWLSNVNYQDAHSRMGLSAQMGGTGMVIRPSVLEEIGWHVDSLTEDLVLTARYVALRRRACVWVHDARLYDEKPLALRASVKQRTRWMQGHMDAAIRYGLPGLVNGIGHMSLIEIDMALYLIRPLLNLLMFGCFALRWVIAIAFPASVLNRAFLMTPEAALLLRVFYLLMQVYALFREGYLKYALYIPLCYAYALSWYVPILRGLVKRKERFWVSTAHTRDLGIGEVKEDVAINDALSRLRGIDNLHRMALGQILVKSATITSTQLADALERQRATGGQLGEIILDMQVVSKETLDTYLALQKQLKEKAEEENLADERLRIGDLLVDAGVITAAQLQGAIEYQRMKGCLLGESLVMTKAMSPDMLETFLKIQHILDENYLTPQRALHLINGVMRESVNNLGMLLFAGGLISRYQLDTALAYQAEHGGVIGEIIVKLGFVSQEHIDTLLEIQKVSRQSRTAKEGGRTA